MSRLINIEDLPKPSDRTGWPWTQSAPYCPERMGNGREWPRISIITPSFNQGRFLEETIRSVLLQGYPNLEYIVMDGGSTDDSVDVIRKYEPWISQWSSGKDDGQADAIYRGFERATGELVAWQNSDDLYLPGALLAFGRLFASHPRAELAIGGCVWIDADGATMRSRAGFPLYYPGRSLTFNEALLWGMGGNQPATMYRRDAFFAAGGFDRSLHCCFDYDSILRLVHRRTAHALRKPIACFRVHGDSKTTTQQRVFEQEAQKIRDGFQWDGRPRWRRDLAKVYYSRREAWMRRFFLFRQMLRRRQTNSPFSMISTAGSEL